MRAVTLSAAITHCDWDEHRRIWLNGVQRALPHAVVVRDTKRNLWDTTRRAWLAATADEYATHSLVMQDDMLPCRNFEALLVEALETRPEAVVCYFSMRQALLKARSMKMSWLVSSDATWGGTTVLPRPLALDFLRWERANIDPAFKSADRRVVLYLVTHKIPVYVTAPSLVQHEGWDESLIGHPGRIGKLVRRSPWVADGEPIDWDTPALAMPGTVKFDKEMTKAARA